MSAERGGGLRALARRLLWLLAALLAIFVLLVLIDRFAADEGISGFLYDGF